MSQWSRRASGARAPQRNLSLPIFFEGMQETDQTAEIREALRTPMGPSTTGAVTIGLSCLSLRAVPVQQIAAYVQELEHMYMTQGVDYDQLFADKELELILDLQVNLIETIPSEVFQLKKLKGLFLRSNKLSTISPQIGLLTGLTALTLANNPIEYLPVEIQELPLVQFTISPKHFLTAAEINERNSHISFAGSRTLGEACLRSLTASSPASLHRSLTSKYDTCSVCKNYVVNAQKFFQLAEYKGERIPLAVSLCSAECQKQCQSATPQSG